MRITVRSMVLAAGITLVVSGAAAAQSPSPVPLPPVFDDTAIPADPIPGGIVDPRPTTWDHVTIEPDGRTITVAFWNGAEACSGLDHLAISGTAGDPDPITITPWIGTRVDAAGADCADIRQLYATTVTLDAPILAGGIDDPTALTEPPAGMGAARWESVDLGPDGRTGWMRFSTGDPACSSFDHIRVDSAGAIPGLFAVIAFPVDQPQLCTAIAQLHREPFTLPEPLILGGDPPA